MRKRGEGEEGFSCENMDQETGLGDGRERLRNLIVQLRGAFS